VADSTVWQVQWCWCGRCAEISVYNVRHVWESERRRVFTCSSIHLAVGVFGFMGAVERVASRIYS
jgi:hypothetical protein